MIMKDTFTIHDLPLTERPRERLLEFGIEALSTQEVLALVLGRGIRGESVLVTAKKLLVVFGSLENIAKASLAELSQINGIGPAKAAQIKAAFELGNRLECVSNQSGKGKIKNPEDVLNLVKKRLKGLKKEYFLAISLDTRNHIIDIQTISIGSLNSSIVHPREVFKAAITACAASVIFIHNHPSGDPEPSEEDKKLTRRLVEAGDLLGIEVLDHIIFCDNTYLSMKASNMV